LERHAKFTMFAGFDFKPAKKVGGF